MIMTPNRLEGIVDALEKGDPVDYSRVADLQVLDLVIAGRKHVEQAIQFQEQEDEQAARELRERETK